MIPDALHRRIEDLETDWSRRAELRWYGTDPRNVWRHCAGELKAALATVQGADPEPPLSRVDQLIRDEDAALEARVPHEPPAFDDWASHIVDGIETKAPSQIEYEIVEGLKKASRLGLEAHAARPAPPLDWQPIETAPKDQRVLIAHEHGVFIARWSDEAMFERFERRPGWQIFDCEDGFYSWSVENPSHWKPIPDPPAAVPQAAQE